jgi:hypothetical protein
LLALLALIPFAAALSAEQRHFRKRALVAPVIAVIVAATLVGGELASGAGSFGTKPSLPGACVPRAPFSGHGADAAGQRAFFSELDKIACIRGESREQLVVDFATSGLGAGILQFAGDGAAQLKRLFE